MPRISKENKKRLEDLRENTALILAQVVTLYVSTADISKHAARDLKLALKYLGRHVGVNHVNQS